MNEIVFSTSVGQEFEVVIDDQSNANHRPAVATGLEYHAYQNYGTWLWQLDAP